MQTYQLVHSSSKQPELKETTDIELLTVQQQSIQVYQGKALQAKHHVRYLVKASNHTRSSTRCMSIQLRRFSQVTFPFLVQKGCRQRWTGVKG